MYHKQWGGALSSVSLASPKVVSLCLVLERKPPDFLENQGAFVCCFCFTHSGQSARSFAVPRWLHHQTEGKYPQDACALPDLA